MAIKETPRAAAWQRSGSPASAYLFLMCALLDRCIGIESTCSSRGYTPINCRDDNIYGLISCRFCVLIKISSASAVVYLSLRCAKRLYEAICKSWWI
jgi:hypothetical protein